MVDQGGLRSDRGSVYKERQCHAGEHSWKLFDDFRNGVVVKNIDQRGKCRTRGW
jgi:hypothetical protein